MTKSPGAQITGALLEDPARRRFDIDLDRKAAAGNILAYPPTPVTLPRVIPGPALPLRLRDLIPQGSITGSGIVYLRETSITNSTITPIAPGALKTQAQMTYDVVTQSVVTIPAYLKIPSQYWEDFAVLQSWMDTRLLYSMALAEESALLNGWNGAGAVIQGLLAAAMITGTVAGTGGAALLDNIAAGIAAVYSRGYLPDGIVVNSADWGGALTAKAGGLYILGEPTDMEAPFTLWTLPLVVSPSMPSGTYLVGQFSPFSQIFGREEVAVEIADQNEDDFLTNLVTMRAEERLAFAVYQPAAFAKGTYTP